MNRGEKQGHVLVVEDEMPAVRLLEEAFGELEDDVTITVATDGEQALDVLSRSDDSACVSLPDVVILDLDLPKVGGKAVLREMRETEDLARVPVVVLSQHDDRATIDECYRLGANVYIEKPPEYEGLLEVTRRVSAFWKMSSTQCPSS